MELNHECEGEWVPPATVGGTMTRRCTSCGRYDTQPTLNDTTILDKPEFVRLVKSRTGGATYGT